MNNTYIHYHIIEYDIGNVKFGHIKMLIESISIYAIFAYTQILYCTYIPYIPYITFNICTSFITLLLA